MYLILGILLLLTVLTTVVLSHPKFGKLPRGDHLRQIKSEQNFKNGSFRNQSLTQTFTPNANGFIVARELFFRRSKRAIPKCEIPSVKTDLNCLDVDKDVLVWFGHSSYFLQIEGRRILVDPVFSSHASPFSFFGKAFRGSNIYSVDDIPEIDWLLITHDHWDHLDYPTVKRLQPKVKQAACGLGAGSHLKYWGYAADQITERNWNQQVASKDGIEIYTVPARHFSGRGLKRNKTLWTSFVLKTKGMTIFIGGDGGYDTHFASIGKSFGPFDLAVLENGQYNKNWKNIHMMPEEVIRAANDLNAKNLLPVHNSKFSLSTHAWDEPLIRISNLCRRENISLWTPKIGEQVNLKAKEQQFSKWWQKIT